MDLHPVQDSRFPAAAAQGADSPASGGSSSASTATVSANDFLQLLVAELKNQDPTASKDPNEYINQLVQVNSLEQLIQINEELGTAPATGSSPGSASPSERVFAQRIPAAAHASGNLSVPETGTAARRLARALQPSPGPPAAPRPAAERAPGSFLNRGPGSQLMVIHPVR